MNSRTRKLTLSGAFIALAVGMGYALAQVPNVELMTAVLFCAGGLLGWRQGIVVAAVAEFLFSTLNPFGPAALPVLAGQIAAMAVVGAGGGWLVPAILRRKSRLHRAALFAALGFLLTLQFDFLTTLATGWMMGVNLNGLIGLFAVGAPFMLTHLVSNLVVFILLVPVVLERFLPRAAAKRSAQKEPEIEPTAPCDV